MRVRERHGVADAQKHAQALGEVVSGRHPAVEAIAADAFHRIEQPPVRQLAEVVDRDDAGMFEPGQDPRFVRVARRPLDDLERDLPIEHDIACQIHDPHPAASEDRDDLVARAGHVRRPEHRGQAIECGLGDHPVSILDSASNSSSDAH